LAGAGVAAAGPSQPLGREGVLQRKEGRKKEGTQDGLRKNSGRKEGLRKEGWKEGGTQTGRRKEETKKEGKSAKERQEGTKEESQEP
jgi:hypothetical protein